jgi:hypothetical protein
MRGLALALLLLGGNLATACLGDLEPETGPLVGAPCSDEDSNPGEDVSFQADLLGALFVDPPGQCLSCHDPNGTINAGYSIGGLDLTSYDELLAGGVNSANNIVLPGSPCDSVLYQKLSPAPPFGGRMPLSGPPFIDDATLGKVADWIAEGADEN